MSVFFYLFFVLVGLLLLLFAWSVRRPRRGGKSLADAGVLEECGAGHIAHLPQIRQAFAERDFVYLSRAAPAALVRRVRQERRRMALIYLSAVREDFRRLLRMARIVAALSPEVAALQEFERVRLTVKFGWRYEVIRMQLRAGMAPLSRLDGLSEIVSGLSVGLETAMKELGERAALAAELASTFEGSSHDTS